MQNRASYLKKAQRKQRNHRLILKGVAIETIMPCTEHLSDMEFYALAERIFQLDAVKELVERATAKDGD